MTAFKPIEDLARKAAKYAVEMGSGKGVAELEDVTETVNDGTYEIPSCILEPTAVTKENIDKVFRDYPAAFAEVRVNQYIALSCNKNVLSCAGHFLFFLKCLVSCQPCPDCPVL